MSTRRKKSNVAHEIAAIAKEMNESDDHYPLQFPEDTAPVPVKRQVKSDGTEVIPPLVPMTPAAVKKRMISQLKTEDIDEIFAHWVEMARTSSNPSWGRLFADNFFPDNDDAGNPLEDLFLRVIEQAVDRKSYREDVDAEMQGYIDIDVE